MTDGLVARDAELEELRGYLTGGTRVVSVLGVAGSGKSALLSAAMRSWRTDGGHVLRVQGHATEHLLGFSTLLDVLDAGAAVGSGAASEEASGAESIRALVEGGGEESSEALRLRRSLYQWLLMLAADEPVLVVVDDVQWVDAASWLVLSFAANRVSGSTVSFLFASRSDTAPLALQDHPVLRIRPLEMPDALRLLDRAGPVLDALTRTTVVERAAGNPLALLELARVSGIASADATGGAGRGAGAVDGPEVPAAVEAAFAEDLPGLPEQTRRVLLLAAAGATELAVLDQAFPGGQVARLLEPAENAGLIRVHGRRLSFRHPLVRSTIYDLATTHQRHTAHATLAELYPDHDDRRVWHRAAATGGPDDTVAADLITTSGRLFGRGAHREAVEAVVRASELTVDPDLRNERLLEGVSLSSSAGWMTRLTALSSELRNQTTDPVLRARATGFQAYALAQTMRQAAAQQVLEDALDEFIKVDPVAGWASLTTLASLVYQTGQRRDMLEYWLERYESLTPHGWDDSPINAAARGWIQMTLRPLARPAELKQMLRDAPASLPGDWPDYVRAAYDILQGAIAWLLDEHQTALRMLTRANETMERTGANHQLVQNTMALGQVQYDMGLYDDADRSGRLMVDIAEAQVLTYYQSVGRELRARVASVRGDSAQALADIDQLLVELEPGQAPALEANLYVGRANALFGLRDHESAYLQLRALFESSGVPLHEHVSTRALGDLASAAVRVGRAAEVRELVRAAEAHVSDIPGERMSRVVARAKALVGDEDDAAALFDRAVNEPGASTWPLEWANAQLDYGVWLRRQHRAADARDLLRSAHRVYLRLGARPWASAAEAELRASGVRLDAGDDAASGWSDLTGQEREIVLLAASGMTNKQIGESLFLSPRTVGAHLYHAFPKLGVTSRNQLRDLVHQLRDG